MDVIQQQLVSYDSRFFNIDLLARFRALPTSGVRDASVHEYSVLRMNSLHNELNSDLLSSAWLQYQMYVGCYLGYASSQCFFCFFYTDGWTIPFVAGKTV